MEYILFPFHMSYSIQILCFIVTFSIDVVLTLSKPTYEIDQSTDGFVCPRVVIPAAPFTHMVYLRLGDMDNE